MINAAGLTNPLSKLTLTQLYGNIAEGTMGPDLLSPGGQITAVIRQRNIGATAPAMYNFIRIVQEGAGHQIFSDQAGYNNRAAITQSATANSALAETSQFGYNNGIVLRQTGGADYSAIIRQGPVIPGGTFGTPFPTTNPALSNTIKNTATLTQSGEAGSADIVQAGSSSRFTGVQKGGTPIAPNSILIRQDNLSAIDLDQDGESSNIEIRQNGWQYARATQGEQTVRNNIIINQGANRLQDTKNTAIVTQNSGDSNFARVNQNTSQSEKNDTRIVQNGSRRAAGNNSEIRVDQEGKSGRTILTQTETSRGSEIDVLQTNSEVFKGSHAEVMQGGEDNEFNVEQDGNLQVVMGTQEGEDNITNVDQEGQRNLATVNQHGSDNEIDIEQENEPSSPIGNKATANQADGTSDSDITITQAVGTDGDGNVAVVNQTRGDDNNTTITQDALNEAYVTQSGSEYENAPATGSNVDIDQSESTSGVATVVQQAGTFGNQVAIEQDEVGNRATVTQTGGRLNETDIFQNDNGNTATVTQGGNENTAGPGATPNTIDIDQNGKGAMATVTQMNNTNGSSVIIDQNDSDIAEVMQANGERLDVDIDQSGANLGTGNIARTSQTGENNTLEIDQRFNNNVVGGSIANGGMALQKGRDNDATLNQLGSNNKIALDQDGSDNTIDIEQDNEEIGGTGNQATAIQGVSSSDGDITIDQGVNTDGDGNVAIVNQTRGDMNSATVSQDALNTATVTQSGSEDELSNTGSTVNIDQSNSTGGNATATQANGTFGGTISITQVEEDNTATVSQTNGRLNNAVVNQIEDGNTATVTQSGTMDNAGGFVISQVLIDQEGKNGTATVTQSANGSIVDVLQTNGDRNQATVVSQSGRINDIGIEQYGDENIATVTQSGQENQVRTLQTNLFDTASPDNGPASHEATVIQGGTLNDAVIGQGGLNNAATITQGTGQTQFASTIQYGERNVATTTQNGAGPTNTVNIVQSQILAAGGGAFGGAILASRASRNAETVAAALRTNAAAAVTAGDIGQAQDNTARVTQTAGTVTNQSVELYQTGNEESAIISQGGTVGGNTLLAVQAGESDELTSAQTGATGDVEVNQYGTPNSIGNVAGITQGGTNNEILVNQVKFGNTATINQSGNDHNTALAGAVGVNVTQIGENNAATVGQSGNRNSTAVIQGVVGASVFGGFTSAGVGNVPDDDAFRNTAGVTQTGLDNAIGVVQQGDDGTATVNQAGNDNTIGIRQLNPGGGPLRAVFNVATATQTAGVANSIIDIEQFGRRNNGSATQSGTGVNNNIALDQRNDDNVAILSQNQGNQNVINVLQNPDAGKLGGRVEIAQVGQDNKARLRQTGYENKLTLTQTGDRNVLQQNGGNPFALQGGHNNTATLLQTGEDHTINLNQSGMNNTIMVTQSNL